MHEGKKSRLRLVASPAELKQSSYWLAVLHPQDSNSPCVLSPAKSSLSCPRATAVTVIKTLKVTVDPRSASRSVSACLLHFSPTPNHCSGVGCLLSTCVILTKTSESIFHPILHPYIVEDVSAWWARRSVAEDFQKPYNLPPSISPPGREK